MKWQKSSILNFPAETRESNRSFSISDKILFNSMKEFLDFSFAIIISTSNKLPELVFAGVVYCVLECYKYL